MKRAFAWLFPLGAVATLLSFPFPPPIVNSSIAVAIVGLLVFAGLWFGEPHGLGSAIPSIQRVAWSLLIGVASGGLVLAMLPLLGLSARMKMDGALPLWQRFVMSFDAAILEEIIFRLFIVSFVVWIVRKFARRNAALWAGIAVAALAFGAAHLPRWISYGPGVIAAVLFVNAVAAVILCLVYVKWGIEAAMCTHFAADVTTHVLGPYLFA